MTWRAILNARICRQMKSRPATPHRSAGNRSAKALCPNLTTTRTSSWKYAPARYGDRSALFAGNLFSHIARATRSISALAGQVISESPGESAATKSLRASSGARGVFALGEFEVKRTSCATRAGNRSHGAAFTPPPPPVAVSKADDVAAVDINQPMSRVDTFRASGADGQHQQNRFGSAFDAPTGLSLLECQDGRSQRRTRSRPGACWPRHPGSANARRAGEKRPSENRSSAPATARRHPHLQFSARA